MATILGIKPTGRNKCGLMLKWGGHDAGACLIDSGDIIAMAEEERFSRVKRGIRPSFPYESIGFVLDYANLDLADIDAIAIGRDHKLQIDNITEIVTSSSSFLEIVDNMYRNTRRYYQYNYNNSPIKYVSGRIENNFEGEFSGEYIEIPHHRSHAASALYCSGFDEPTVITMDGKGETESTVLWDANLNRIKQFSSSNSLGKFYSLGTQHLGYDHGSDAGKVMGLASYGNYRKDFDEKMKMLTDINKKDGSYDVTKIIEGGHELLEEYFGPRKFEPDEFEEWHKDFAYHLQKRLEEIVKQVVKYSIDTTGNSNLAFAGGIGMNCKLNREISNIDKVNNLYIQPAANDSGICLGAALEGYYQLTRSKPVVNLEHLYYGPEYENQLIEKELNKSRISWEKLDPNEVSKIGANLLSNGNIIGWFQGRMEFGARALGNRSILANPTLSESLDKVNSKVKNREEWRPFAPTLLHSHKEEYLVNGGELPYMIILDSVKESKKEEIPAVTHVDGTTRPQTIRKEQNERYWKLIKNFEELTGVPVVLNTSFNTSGEPIVESPNQAIADFFTTGLDALIINDYLITK